MSNFYFFLIFFAMRPIFILKDTLEKYAKPVSKIRLPARKLTETGRYHFKAGFAPFSAFYRDIFDFKITPGKSFRGTQRFANATYVGVVSARRKDRGWAKTRFSARGGLGEKYAKNSFSYKYAVGQENCSKS